MTLRNVELRVEERCAKGCVGCSTAAIRLRLGPGWSGRQTLRLLSQNTSAVEDFALPSFELRLGEHALGSERAQLLQVCQAAEHDRGKQPRYFIPGG